MKKLLAAWWFWGLVLVAILWFCGVAPVGAWITRAKLALFGPPANPHVAPGAPGGAPAQTADTLYESSGAARAGAAPSAPYLGAGP